MGEPVGGVLLVADVFALDAVGELRQALAVRDVEVHTVDAASVSRPGELTALLRAERPRAVVDGTHPFAEPRCDVVRRANAAGVASARLLSEPWRPQPGDRWIEVDGTCAAAEELTHSARRVFLSARPAAHRAFSTCAEQWFLVRGPIGDDGGPPNVLSLPHGTRPVTIERELEMLGEHFIDTVVVQNDGERTTMATLEAARSLGLTVISERRPPLPSGVDAASVADVLALVDPPTDT